MSCLCEGEGEGLLLMFCLLSLSFFVFFLPLSVWCFVFVFVDAVAVCYVILCCGVLSCLEIKRTRQKTAKPSQGHAQTRQGYTMTWSGCRLNSVTGTPLFPAVGHSVTGFFFTSSFSLGLWLG